MILKILSWLKKFRAFANIEEGFLSVLEFCSDEKFSPDKNHSAIAAERIFIEPISLAHQSFNAVANDCAAEFFTCRKADFAVIAFVVDDKQNQRMIRERLPAIVYRVEVVLAAIYFTLAQSKHLPTSARR